MGVKTDRDQILSALPEVENAGELVLNALELGQEHLFADWRARSPQYRENLVRELARIDWEVLKEAIGIVKDDSLVKPLDESQVLPMPMRTYSEQEPFRAEEEETGRQALIEGQVAWLVPAGGSGSRLVKVLEEIYASLPFQRRYRVADEQMRSFDEACAKGQLPITPVLGKTLYGLFIEQALALGARVNRMPVLLLMLSDETREASLFTITNHPLYKSLEPAIVLFDHGMNPVLDNDGRIIAKDPEGHLVFSGNGNGGMFKGMWHTPWRGESSIFTWLKKQGIQTVGFSNVDNPVSDIILPRMLGSQIRLGVELSFGVVRKVDPFERVGMIVQLAGQPNLDKIEYNVFPESLAAKVNPDDPGRLLFEHGDVNVFLMDLGRMEKVSHLPLCMYRNKSVRTAWGAKTGNKFESFTFHIIQQSAREKVDVKEILREDQFMPTKNSIGWDSPATVIRALCTRNMRWLEAQGASVAQQDLAGSLADYVRLAEKMILPAAAAGPLEKEAGQFAELAAAMKEGSREPSVEELFRAALDLGARAEKAGLEQLKLAADHAYSVVQPGEAAAFVEFSPAFALEAGDLAEACIGEGWVLERGCQVAFTGHPTQVLPGSGFKVGKNAVFILDIRNEYGEIRLSPDRWLTFVLEQAGGAEIGDVVTIEDGAEVEIHVHGSGKVVIPEGTVFRGERFVEVGDGEVVTVEG